MSELIATFKLKEFGVKERIEHSDRDLTDMLKDIAEKNDMELISWGTI